MTLLFHVFRKIYENLKAKYTNKLIEMKLSFKYDIKHTEEVHVKNCFHSKEKEVTDIQDTIERLRNYHLNYF